MTTSTLNPMENATSQSASAVASEDLAALVSTQAKRIMEKIPLLGAVTWLMLQQSGMRHTLLSELDWRVLPPLALEQAKVYLRDGAPVAYVSWACLSEPVAQRYAASKHQLMPAEWRSGQAVWIVDLIAPFGGGREVIADLQASVLVGQALWQLMPGESGGMKSHLWPATQAKSA